jgi:2-methylisocitrate lyase-like PEP mutase family enzyme
MALAGLARALAALHAGPAPLLIPSAWDVSSARLLEMMGFPAIATSSRAIADALGHPDNDSMPVEDVFSTIARIAAAVEVPVTADLEGGYQLSPDELVDRLLWAGAVGLDIEDSDHHGGSVLVDPEVQAGRIAAIKEAGRARRVELVLNARTDVYKRALPGAFIDALHRAGLYREAGADCIFPIGLEDEHEIAGFVTQGLPLNVLARCQGPPVVRLAVLGVRRISLGPMLHHAALEAVEAAAGRARAALGAPA